MFFACSGTKSIQNTNKDGILIDGYDVVSYYTGKPILGVRKYSVNQDGVLLYFANAENMSTFQENPVRYMPAYGGYCAYAMGKNGTKVAVDPMTFEIRRDTLYLFYNSLGNNTLDKWLDDTPTLKKQADINWLKYSK